MAMGFLTFTAKDEPGIGFRVGYTYLSKRARIKANRVSGIGVMITGLGLMVLSPFLSMNWLMVSRPLVFQLAPRFKGKMAIGFARA